MSQEVTLIFDGDTGTIFKHGPPAAVRAYMRSEQGMKLNTYFPVRHITFAASAEAADWINQVLASSGSLLYRLKELLEKSTPVK